MLCTSAAAACGRRRLWEAAVAMQLGLDSGVFPVVATLLHFLHQFDSLCLSVGVLVAASACRSTSCIVGLECLGLQAAIKSLNVQGGGGSSNTMVEMLRRHPSDNKLEEECQFRCRMFSALLVQLAFNST